MEKGLGNPGQELAWRPAEPPHTTSAHGRIDALESAIGEHLDPVAIPPEHHFADGIYSRTIIIPAGVLLTGRTHKGRHLNIVSAGAISIFCVGEEPRLIVAPAVFVSEPGARRVGLAHETTVWTTVHENPTNTRDLDELERAIVEPRSDESLAAEVRQLLRQQRAGFVVS